MQHLRLAVALCLCLLPLARILPAQPELPAAVQKAISRAGDNGNEIRKAAVTAPAAQRSGMWFLIEHMPARDLRTLAASFLLQNVDLAYQARAKLPWGKKIPEQIFLNDVLPYAHITEKREPWRADLMQRCLPLVKDCKTAAEAAQRLNEKIFPLLGVRYSTRRRRADQSPSESIEQGMASCTGLSILLADACRSVAVPARLAGTASWARKRGNHTWVEIWDQRWQFTGAAEPSKKGLNHTWFQADAAHAVKGSERNGIWANSWRHTGKRFPMVWSRRVTVPGVEVTSRYLRTKPAADVNLLRLLVRVRNVAGQRVKARVSVQDSKDKSRRWSGQSRDEGQDTNDILAFRVPRGSVLLIQAEASGHSARRQLTCDGRDQQTVDLVLGPKPQESNPANKFDIELRRFFATTAREQQGFVFSKELQQLLRRDEEQVRRLAWHAYRKSSRHIARKRDFDARRVRKGRHLSPYTFKTVGKKPKKGWPLFIAMHGGGGTAKRVNDSQWRHMQRYYRDHPEAGGYLYLALRAPNDEWNGFYADYVYPLVAELIEQFLLFGDVNPDKVYAMGYSHGGYGAFAIGPKMPDRFAAVHSSAAAPTDNETSAKTLRTLRFTYMIGGRDRAYGRIDRCRAFDRKVRELKGERKDVYDVVMELHPDRGHGGLPDRDKIADMYPHTRMPVPAEVSWEMTDSVIRDFYWLRCDQPAKKREVSASLRDNRCEIQSKGVTSVTLCLDRRLCDPEKPLQLVVNGRQRPPQDLAPSVEVLCRSLQRRGDPRLAYTIEVPVSLPVVR